MDLNPLHQHSPAAHRDNDQQLLDAALRAGYFSPEDVRYAIDEASNPGAAPVGVFPKPGNFQILAVLTIGKTAELTLCVIEQDTKTGSLLKTADFRAELVTADSQIFGSQNDFSSTRNAAVATIQFPDAELLSGAALRLVYQ